MKILGIIAEYNPFHRGHSYHIDQALRRTGADAAIVVMSGDFVQRGEPAIYPKHSRVRMALTQGAAVVLELPVCYACGSAEYFAQGAVSLLHSLNCVDYLCFGSECGNIDQLSQIARILYEEPDKYRELLQTLLRSGISFPQARAKAFEEYTGDKDLTEILQTPNNILGIEYLKALYQLKSNIRPFTILREGAGYHDKTLNDSYSSASAIRNQLQKMSDSVFSMAEGQVPDTCYRILSEQYLSRGPIFCDDYSLLLKYRLLSETVESLQCYADISGDLAHRIVRQRNLLIHWTQFCNLLKTKELTFSRISRCLLHILLNIKSEDMHRYRCNHNCYYARILGFKKSEQNILKVFKQQSQVPVLTKLNGAQLCENGLQMLNTDIYASNLYESVITDKYAAPFIEEHSKQLVIIE